MKSDLEYTRREIDTHVRHNGAHTYTLKIDGANHYRFVAIESFKRCNQNDDGEGFILFNQQLLLSHAHPIKSRTTEVKMSTGGEGTESEKENNSKDCQYLTFKEMMTCWRKAQKAVGAHLKMKQHAVYSIAMMGQSIKGKYTQMCCQRIYAMNNLAIEFGGIFFF